MNVPLVAAGSLAVLGAAIHGVGGEVLVVRKLSPAMLPSSRFGGPRVTKTMIHATWHMTTIAFLSVGCGAPARGLGAARRRGQGIGLVAAGASTGFAAVAAGRTGLPSIAAAPPGPRPAHRHAALAGRGAL